MASHYKVAVYQVADCGDPITDENGDIVYLVQSQFDTKALAKATMIRMLNRELAENPDCSMDAYVDLDPDHMNSPYIDQMGFSSINEIEDWIENASSGVIDVFLRQEEDPVLIYHVEFKPVM